MLPLFPFSLILYPLGTNAPNREDFNEITLTIEARDQGTPVLSDIAIIRITLNDLNDNSPAFESPSYTLDVDEDTLTSKPTFSWI